MANEEEKTLYFEFWNDSERQQDSEREEKFLKEQQNAEIIKRQTQEDLNEFATEQTATVKDRRLKFF